MHILAYIYIYIYTNTHILFHICIHNVNARTHIDLSFSKRWVRTRLGVHEDRVKKEQKKKLKKEGKKEILCRLQKVGNMKIYICTYIYTCEQIYTYMLIDTPLISSLREVGEERKK